MNPTRNSNLASEASAIRSILKSTIEPFGVIGIPTITLNAKEHADRIREAIYRYAMHMCQMRRNIPTRAACEQAEYLARYGGATWAKCCLYRESEDGGRIFFIQFRSKGYPRIMSFGFAIGKLTREPV